MKYVFFSDPHLGVARNAHTTKQSAARLRQAVYDETMNILQNLDLEEHMVFCGGDLFDSAQNSEDVLHQGADVVRLCNYVLAGNHDMANRDGVVTSFDLMHDIVDMKGCLKLGTDEAGYIPVATGREEALVYAVPHHSSQEAFDKTLSELQRDLSVTKKKEKRAILLHCSVDLTFETAETSLNITTEQLRGLAEHVDQIFIGHEHQPRKLSKVKTTIMGNILPLTMGELGPRYFYVWDTDTDMVESLPIFSPLTTKQGLITALNYPTMPTLPEQIRYLICHGSVSAAEGPKVMAWISKLWQTCPNLFMLKNQIEIQGLEWKAAATTEHDRADLGNFIKDQLAEKDKDLFAAWEKYSAV